MAGAVLSDRDIIAFHRKGVDIVTPFIEEFVQPSSIDLRLGEEVYEYHLDYYVLGEKIPEEKIKKKAIKDKEPLKPGETRFFSIYETIQIPLGCMGLILPRSSISRLGLVIQPVYVNPGYKGRLPLTVSNSANFEIFLKPLVRIAQLIVIKLFSEPFRSYSAVEDQKYYGEKKALSNTFKWLLSSCLHSFLYLLSSS
jgi:dCTP deaminase